MKNTLRTKKLRLNTTCMLSVLFVFLALLVSCRKADLPTSPALDQTNTSGYSYDIYILGAIYDTQSGNESGCYWINGAFHNMGTNTKAGMMKYLDNKLYIAGGNDKTGNNYKACLWINGVASNLAVPADTTNSYVNDFLFENGLLYAVGIYAAATNSGGCLWISNTVSNLIRGWAAIGISGQNITMGGQIGNNASYFYNGAEIDLESAPMPDQESGITSMVIDTYTYFAGYKFQPSSNGREQHACYWSNSIRVDLATNIASSARSIMKYGADLYMAGYSTSNASDVACYWKNDHLIVLDTNYSEAYGLCVVDGDIFVTGGYLSGTSFIPCYWKNGTRCDLPGGGNTMVRGAAIIVKRR